MTIIATLIVCLSYVTSNSVAGNGDLIVDGKLGVGTSPTFKIHGYHLADNNNAPLKILAIDADYTSSAANNFGAGLVFRSRTDGNSLLEQAMIASAVETIYVNNQSGLAFYTTDNASTMTEKMRINARGSVSIGSRDPGSYKFHVTKMSNVNGEPLKVTAIEADYPLAATNNFGAGLVFRSRTDGNALVEQAMIASALETVYVNNQSGLAFYTTDNASAMSEKVRINARGNVSIGTVDSQGYKLFVAGQAYSTGGWYPSDIRFKKNLEPIKGSMEKVLDLTGLSYEWKTDEYKDKGFPEGRHYGVIAQEVEKVLPEVVNTGSDGTKAVAYTELIPVLIEAIKEQQKEIELLKKTVANLQK
jgi:hypothetical protein